MEIISDREQKLCATLEGREKAMFLEYIQAYQDVYGEIALKKFIVGFKLGARTMIDVFNTDTA